MAGCEAPLAFPLEGKVAAVRRSDEGQRTPFAFPLEGKVSAQPTDEV